MAYDFQKLTTDVAAALQAGLSASALSDDKGPSNFDGVILYVPGAGEDKVIDALAKAGVRTRKGGYGVHGTGYMINPVTDGQGNKRTAGAEAIGKHLSEAGHNIAQFYQMD